MSNELMIHRLEQKHDLLQQEISKVQNQALPNVSLLRELKVRKLQLKEELFKLLSK